MITELLNPDNIDMSVFQGLSLIMLFHRKKDFSVAFHSSNMTNYSNLDDQGDWIPRMDLLLGRFP
jgi:hypothetical protein